MLSRASLRILFQCVVVLLNLGWTESTRGRNYPEPWLGPNYIRCDGELPAEDDARWGDPTHRHAYTTLTDLCAGSFWSRSSVGLICESPQARPILMNLYSWNGVSSRAGLVRLCFLRCRCVEESQPVPPPPILPSPLAQDVQEQGYVMVPQDQVAGSSVQGNSLEPLRDATLDDEEGWTEIFRPGGEADQFRNPSDPGTSQKHCEGMECFNKVAAAPSVLPVSDLPQPRKARRPPVSNDLPKPRRPNRRPIGRKSRKKAIIKNPALQDPTPYYAQDLQPICGNQCASNFDCLPGCYCRLASHYVLGYTWDRISIYQAFCVPFVPGNPGEHNPGGFSGMSGMGNPRRSGAVNMAGWSNLHRRDD